MPDPDPSSLPPPNKPGQRAARPRDDDDDGLPYLPSPPAAPKPAPASKPAAAPSPKKPARADEDDGLPYLPSGPSAPPPSRVAPAKPTDPLSQFLAEAAPAIAMSGGINSASLARLRAIAQKHGLSAEQMQDAIRSLGGGPAAQKPAPKATKTRTNQLGFRTFALVELKKTKVFGPLLYERLVGAAGQFGLDELEAAELLDRVSTELKIPFVSMSEAEQKLTDRARELSSRGSFGPKEYEELQEEARVIGVPSDRVRALADELFGADWRERRRKIAGVPVWTAAAATVLLLVGGGIAVFLAVQPDPEPPPEPAKGADTAKSAPPPPPPPPPPPKWAPPALTAALERAAASAPPDFADDWKRAGDDAPAERAKAYERLTGALATTSSDGLAALAHGYAAENNEKNAQALLSAVRAVVPDRVAAPTAEAVERWFAGAELGARMTVAPGVSADRATQAGRALEYVLGEKLDAGLKGDELLSRVELMTSARVYGHLAGAAKTAPAAVLELVTALRPRGEKALGAESLARLETDLAVAVLAAPDTPVGPLRPLLRRVAASGAAARVRLFTVYEKMPAGAPQRVVEDVLLDAAGVVKGSTPEETLANLRAAFGGGPAPADSRAGRLQTLVKTLTDKAPPAPDRSVDLLRDAVTLAHFSALACALAGQAKPNDARFDDLLAKRPELNPVGPAVPKLPGGVGKFPGRPLAAPGDEPKLIQTLNSNNANSRSFAFAALASLVPGQGMSAEAAQAMARHLVRKLTQAEMNQVRPILVFVADPRLLLAVADELAQPIGAERPWVESVVGELLGQGVTLTQKEWRTEARRLLMRRLADAGLEESLAQAAAKYKEQITEQGLLLGIDRAEFLLRDEPSAVLEVLIKHLAQRLARDKLSAADKRFLDQLPHLATALEYQRLNDLQKTSALQRALLRVVCLYVAQQNPAAADKAAKLVEDLTAADTRTDNALVRLRDGEEKLLRAWLLLVKTP